MTKDFKLMSYNLIYEEFRHDIAQSLICMQASFKKYISAALQQTNPEALYAQYLKYMACLSR